MKRIISLILLLVILLSACDNLRSDSTASTSVISDGTPNSSESEESYRQNVVMLCMGAIKNPAMQLIQLGFVEKAKQLEHYEPVISGLEDGSIDELQDQWAKDAAACNPYGFVMWGADELYKDFFHEQYKNGAKFVVPYFDPLEYSYSTDFGLMIGANPICDEIARGRQAADYILQCLEADGIHSGTIVFHYDSYYYPGFRDRIEELSDFTVVDLKLTIGSSREESIKFDVPRIQDALDLYSDIVAFYNPVSGDPSSIWEIALGEPLSQTGIIGVTSMQDKAALTSLREGKISAIITNPFYEAGYVGMEMLDRLLQGETFEGDAWQPTLPTYIVTADGTGKNGPDFYLDLWERVEAFSDTVEQ